MKLQNEILVWSVTYFVFYMHVSGVTAGRTSSGIRVKAYFTPVKAHPHQLGLGADKE